MNHRYVLLVALLAAVGLSACNKEPESEANTATEPAANETAQNASGTTTYYGEPEEQPKPANN
jgi:hypothetical protein